MQFAIDHQIKIDGKSAHGIGHAGEALHAQFISSLIISAGAVTRTTEAVAMEMPSLWTELGLGGILSPQSFFEGTVVFDFPRHELIVLRGDAAAVAAWLAEAHPGRPLQALSRRPGNERLLLVDAALDDRPPLMAQVDTGSDATEFIDSYVGPAAGTSRHIGFSVTGAELRGKDLPGRTVHVSGLQFGPMDVESLEILPLLQPSLA